jgi:hypothetical protein
MKNYRITQSYATKQIVKNKKEFNFTKNELIGIKGGLFLFFIIGFLIGLIF